MKFRKTLRIKLNLHQGFFFTGSKTRLTESQQAQGWLVVVLLSFLGGCSSAPKMIPFQNITHRQLYSLNEKDLRQVQFYISTDVVAKYQDAGGAKSLLLARFTPGVVTTAGPNWIKLSFREGGIDIPFVTDPKQYDGRYWLASELEGNKGFKRVTNVPENVFLYKGNPLRVVSGADAYLLIDWEGWKNAVESRKVTEGRRVGGK